MEDSNVGNGPVAGNGSAPTETRQTLTSAAEPVAGGGNPQFPRGDGFTMTVNQEFTPKQLHAMAEHEVKAGRLTREQANQMLANDGVGPLADPTDPNSPDAIVDQQFPPAEPHQFRLPEIKFDDDPTGETAERVGVLARHWMAEARFTRELGNFVLEEAERTSRQWQKMSPQQQNAYKNEQYSYLQKAYGKNTQAKLNRAIALVNRIDAKIPGLKAMLDHTGAGANAMIVTKFILQADLMMQRGR